MGDATFLLLAYCIVALPWAFICKSMAKARGRDTDTGFWCGFLFGLCAVIYYACAGKTEAHSRKEIRQEARWRREAEESEDEDDDDDSEH